MEFEGRNADAHDATLTVTSHQSGGNWLRVRNAHGKFNNDFFFRRREAPLLAEHLLQLADPDKESHGLQLALDELRTERKLNEAAEQRKQEHAARREEAKKLDDEALVFFKAAYPDAVWSSLGHEIQNKFRRVAEAARAMHTKGEK